MVQFYGCIKGNSLISSYNLLHNSVKFIFTQKEKETMYMEYVNSLTKTKTTLKDMRAESSVLIMLRNIEIKLVMKNVLMILKV